MNPSKKNSLFRKYINGDISKEEMHELNLLALEDDFLFDALEGSSGYEERNKTEIQDLDKRLNQKIDHKRNPLIIWLSSAAAIVVVLIATLFLLNPLEEELSAQIAMQEEASEEVLTQDVALEDQTLTSTESRDMSENQHLTGQEVKASPKEQRENITIELTEGDIQQPSFEPRALENQDELIRDENALELNIKEYEQKDQEVLPGEQFQISGNKVPIEEIAINASNPKEISENNNLEDISVKRKEGGVQLTATKELTLSEEDGKAKSKPVNSFTSLPQAARSNAQSKVLDDQKTKKRQAKSSKISTAQVRVFIADDEINSKLLEQFIRQKMTNNLGQFDFQATFTISSPNQALDFNIIKSAGKSLDEELMSLIESFQDWKTLGNKEVRITFK